MADPIPYTVPLPYSRASLRKSLSVILGVESVDAMISARISLSRVAEAAVLKWFIDSDDMTPKLDEHTACVRTIKSALSDLYKNGKFEFADD